MIFESHAHYDDEAFNEDREELLEKLQKDFRIINIGAGMESSRKSLELAKKYPNMYAALGVHPGETGELSEEKMDILKELCYNEKVVAIGEIGLDYYWDEPEREIQKKWFRRQLILADEMNLPVVIHSRDAAEDTLQIMKETEVSKKGVVHCYSYSKELAAEFLKLGYLFGVGGVITFKNGRKLRETVESLPMSAILLETDSPYLAPDPYRGKRNSSLNLPLIIKEIASIKKLSEEEVIRITDENAERLFLAK